MTHTTNKHLLGLIVGLLAACSSDGGTGATPGDSLGAGAPAPASGSTAAGKGATTAGSSAAGSGGKPAGSTTVGGAAGRAAQGGGGTGTAPPAGDAPLGTGGASGTPSAAGASAGAGASAAAGAGGSPSAPTAGAGSSVVDVACNEADKTAAPKPVEFGKPGEGPALGMPTGEFMPIMEADPGIPTHTIIRPEPLGKIKHPIVAWGEGGCGKSGNIGMFSALFREIASQGILIVADGPPGNGPTMEGQDAKPLLFGIDWAIKENERPCSQYYHKLDVTKIGVSGQSCGGLMAIQAAVDPKITTAFPFDSGLFSRDQTIYDALHAPMAIFDGGKDDIAYENGLADFNAITKVPMLFANPKMCSSNAHVCTFFELNAGAFGRAGAAWARWHLLGDQGPTGKGVFIGDGCDVCSSGTNWDIMWKMMPM